MYLLSGTQPCTEYFIIFTLVICISDHGTVEGIGHLLHARALCTSSRQFGLSSLLRTSLIGFNECGTASGLCCRVELEKSAQVAEGVLLERSTRAGFLGWKNNALHFVAIDEAGQIRVGHDVTGQFVALLNCGCGFCGAKNIIQTGESGLGPDDEATEVTSWGQLQQVETIHRGDFDPGNVTESAGDLGSATINDQGTAASDVSSVTHLALTAAEVFGGTGLFNIVNGADLGEKLDGGFGLGDAFCSIVDDKRDFRDVFDAVSPCQKESRKGGGCESRDHGVAFLVDVDFAVPSAPSLGGGEHMTAANHVSECGLACSEG